MPSFSLRLLSFVVVAAAAMCLTAGAPAADFRAGFETGSSTPWDGVQYEFSRPLGESFAVVESPVRVGRFAGRFTVQQGYSPWGWGEATELNWDSGEDEGSDDWYAWSTLFPTTWTAPFGWGIFAEWHSRYPNAPPIAFNARAGGVYLDVNTGALDAKLDPAVSVNRRILGSLSLGRWNDFLVHIHWTSRARGAIQVWTRLQGEQTFRRRVDLHSIPTLQRDSKGPLRIYTLFGLYRASYCGPTRAAIVPGCEGRAPQSAVQAPSVLYEDAFTRGTSRADVLTSAFGDSPGVVAPAAAVIKLGSRPGTVRDSGCSTCHVSAGGDAVDASVAGGLDDRDTAYATRVVGGRRGWSGRVFVRDTIHMPAEDVNGNLSVLQMRDAKGALVYELYVAPGDKTIHLYSPAGGLGGASINLTTGVSVADGAPHRVEVSARANTSLIVRVDGLDRAVRAGLSGARTAGQRVLRVGIDHYDTGGAGDTVQIQHTAVGLSTRGWVATLH